MMLHSFGQDLTLPQSSHPTLQTQSTNWTKPSQQTEPTNQPNPTKSTNPAN